MTRPSPWIKGKAAQTEISTANAEAVMAACKALMGDLEPNQRADVSDLVQRLSMTMGTLLLHMARCQTDDPTWRDVLASTGLLTLLGHTLKYIGDSARNPASPLKLGGDTPGLDIILRDIGAVIKAREDAAARILLAQLKK